MTNENNIPPDIDCPSCGGEGLDADPYGRFDYDCIIACPDCHTIQPTQSDALVTALRFYAREANYRSTTVYMSGQSGKTAIGIDGGQRARTALQEQIK